MTELVAAACGHYVERIGGPPRPLTDDYAEVVPPDRSRRPRRGGRGRLLTHELMSENLALYGRVGYVEYERRSYGGGSLVYMRKRLAGD